MFKVTPVPIYQDNYVWLIHHPSENQVIVIDPGDAQPVLSTLEQNGLNPQAIWITHSHWDHITGLPEIRQRFPEVAVVGPKSDAIPLVTQICGEGDHFNLWDSQVEVWSLPGHMPEHVAYLIHHPDGTKQVFSGDTLFSAGCGRIFVGDHPSLKHSLDRLAALPDATWMYPTHEYTRANLAFAAAVEPENRAVTARISEVETLRAADKPSLPTRISAEKCFNPFIRCHLPSVRDSASSQTGENLEDSLAVFRAIREWKDRFAG